MPMEPIILCEDISFSYQRSEPGAPAVPVLFHLDFKVEKGEFVTILGHNGSGKSTLAKHLNAILLPSGGRALVIGLDTRMEDKLLEIRSHVGMVFQNPDNQIVATVVEEDVAFALENLGVPTPEIRRRVDEALQAVDMYDLRLHAPHQLSGGQKQRVAIAGIIAMRPDCIVLDEPTAMLDPRGRREVLSTLRQLNEEFGITVVLITHFMDEAAQSNRVVVMDEGSILFDAPPAEVFCHVERLKEVGLDVPQTTQLIHELRLCGCELDEHIITEEQCVRSLRELLEKARG